MLVAIALMTMVAVLPLSQAHADSVIRYYIQSDDIAGAKAYLLSRSPSATFTPLDYPHRFIANMSTYEMTHSGDGQPVKGVPGADCVSPNTPAWTNTFTQSPDPNNWPASTKFDPMTNGYSARNAAIAMGASSFWSGGYKGKTAAGKQIDIALIDTGVAPVGELADPNVLVHGPDFSTDSQTVVGPINTWDGSHYSGVDHLDGFGHGTHEAEIIHTMAPDARIVSIKVGSANGVVDASQVIAAIDWVSQHAQTAPFNIRAISLSYGVNSLAGSWKTDELSRAVQMAWNNGVVVVAAAGNNNTIADDPSAPGLMSPAFNMDMIAVGAYDTGGTVSVQDYTKASIAPYSMTPTKAQPRNPDVAAPGSHIISYRVFNAEADLDINTELCLGVDDSTTPPTPVTYPYLYDANGRMFVRESGTSQATAFAAGAVALVLSRSPLLVPDLVKRSLTTTAHSIPGGAKGITGNGAIDLKAVFGAGSLDQLQNHDNAVGGTLEAARGGLHSVNPKGTYFISPTNPSAGNPICTSFSTVTSNTSSSGVALCGEYTIFGANYNSTAHAYAQMANKTFTPVPAKCLDANGATYDCTGEKWAGDGQVWAAAATDFVWKNYGTSSTPLMQKVWPSVKWAKDFTGNDFPTSQPNVMFLGTDWSTNKWVDSYTNDITAWDLSSWRLSSWRRSTWRRSTWRSYGHL